MTVQVLEKNLPKEIWANRLRIAIVQGDTDAIL